MRHQHEPGREPAAGAAPADDDLAPVDAQRLGLVMQPAQRGVTIVERRGKGAR